MVVKYESARMRKESATVYFKVRARIRRQGLSKTTENPDQDNGPSGREHRDFRKRTMGPTGGQSAAPVGSRFSNHVQRFTSALAQTSFFTNVGRKNGNPFPFLPHVEKMKIIILCLPQFCVHQRQENEMLRDRTVDPHAFMHKD
jgi:hypothetical protein